MKTRLAIILALVVLALAAIYAYMDKPSGAEPSVPAVVDDSSTAPKHGSLGDAPYVPKLFVDAEYGISFEQPYGYSLNDREAGSTLQISFQDDRKIFPNKDLHNLIVVSTAPAKDARSIEQYLETYPFINGNTNKPFRFLPRKLGEHEYYYVQTERFEGTLAYLYMIMDHGTVYSFSSQSHGVAWSDQSLNVENDSTHVALKEMLKTVTFVEQGN